MNKNLLGALLLLALSTACGEPPSGAEEPAPRLEPSDFYSRHEPQPVALSLGGSLATELSRASPRHVFSFALPAQARVGLRTEAVAGGPELDTVLTLYGLNARGARTRLAHSDDGPGSLFSALDRTLAAGSYQAEVRGFRGRISGPFSLTTTCEGAGCPPPPSACLFGEVFSDLRRHGSLEIESETWIRHEAQLASDIERAQLLLAVQQSSHVDVRTPGEALQRVDQQEVRQLQLRERASARAFTAYEYGAGDNSYGAIFARGAADVVASIQDGDLLDCSVQP